MTPNQLLAHILKYYYDAFKVGRDSAILEQLEERVRKQVEKLLDEFTRNYRGHETHIVKKFTKWVIDNAKKLGELGKRYRRVLETLFDGEEYIK
jgi:hypothetical protein